MATLRDCVALTEVSCLISECLLVNRFSKCIYLHQVELDVTWRIPNISNEVKIHYIFHSGPTMPSKMGNMTLDFTDTWDEVSCPTDHKPIKCQSKLLSPSISVFGFEKATPVFALVFCHHWSPKVPPAPFLTSGRYERRVFQMLFGNLTGTLFEAYWRLLEEILLVKV